MPQKVKVHGGKIHTPPDSAQRRTEM
jgi:hypothetical protein